MKRSPLALLVSAVALLATSGCISAASSRSTAATFAAERGAPPALVATLQRGERLALADIEKLAVLQTPDDIILAYLRDTGASYELTTTLVDQLRTSGVSDRVIDYLLSTPVRMARAQPSRVWFGYYGFPRGGSFGYHGFGHHGGHR